MRGCGEVGDLYFAANGVHLNRPVLLRVALLRVQRGNLVPRLRASHAGSSSVQIPCALDADRAALSP